MQPLSRRKSVIFNANRNSTFSAAEQTGSPYVVDF